MEPLVLAAYQICSDTPRSTLSAVASLTAKYQGVSLTLPFYELVADALHRLRRIGLPEST